MDLKKQVGQNIKRLRQQAGIRSQAAFAEMCGWSSQSRVGNYESGQRSVSLEDAEVMAKVLGVSAQEILFGTKEKSELVDDSIVMSFDLWDDETPLADDEVALPFYREVELSAGNGSSMVQENHGRKLRFSKATLKRCGVSPGNAACVTVSGNSMEPVLPNGATIGIDKSQTTITDGKMYALDHNGMLRVKICYRLPNGVRLRSYNQDEYPDEMVSFEDNLRVIGKVFWWSVLSY